MAGNGWNGWPWREMAGNGWTRLDMAENLLEVAGISWKWLKSLKITTNG